MENPFKDLALSMHLRVEEDPNVTELAAFIRVYSPRWLREKILAGSFFHPGSVVRTIFDLGRHFERMRSRCASSLPHRCIERIEAP